MNKEVGVIGSHDARYLELTYDDACKLLEKKGDETRLVELQRFAHVAFRSFETRSIIIDIMNEQRMRIDTHPPHHSIEFQDLVVTLEGKQHYIYSNEAQPFVRNCFYSPLRVCDAKVAFILDSFHVRNWAIVTESDRFKVFK